MTLDELKAMKTPFMAININTDKKVTVSGFSQNAPLGVGGGLLPDMPTVYFERGGWLLLSDFLAGYALPQGGDAE